ncbi:proline-rich protein 36-like [Folsomia candida]|uniref:proline-rich protein 36-like n=1 Tax=Folsomia candida TaxID=158441 RepID=UPI0016054128|nr:proline-rich protein 36-like [Folsomia candida]
MPRYTHGGYTYPDPVPRSVLGRRIPSPNLLTAPAPSGTWVQEWNSHRNQLVPVLLPPPSPPPVYTLDDEEVHHPVPPPTNHTISPPVYDISDSSVSSHRDSSRDSDSTYFSSAPASPTPSEEDISFIGAFHRASPPTVDITTPPFSPLGNLTFTDISSSSLCSSISANSSSSSNSSSGGTSSDEITFLGYFQRDTTSGTTSHLLPSDSAPQTDAATPSLRLTFPNALMPQYRPHRPVEENSRRLYKALTTRGRPQDQTTVDFIHAKHSSYKNLIKLIPYDEPTVVRRVLAWSSSISSTTMSSPQPIKAVLYKQELSLLHSKESEALHQLLILNKPPIFHTPPLSSHRTFTSLYRFIDDIKFKIQEFEARTVFNAALVAPNEDFFDTFRHHPSFSSLYKDMRDIELRQCKPTYPSSPPPSPGVAPSSPQYTPPLSWTPSPPPNSPRTPSPSPFDPRQFRRRQPPPSNGGPNSDTTGSPDPANPTFPPTSSTGEPTPPSNHPNNTVPPPTSFDLQYSRRPFHDVTPFRDPPADTPHTADQAQDPRNNQAQDPGNTPPALPNPPRTSANLGES